MSTRDAVAQYVRAPKTVALAVATVLSMVAAFAIQRALVASELAFLAVIVLGVSVPTTLDSYDRLPAEYARVVGVVVVTCLAHWAVFLALFLGFRVGASELLAVAGALLLSVAASAVVGRSLQG